MKFKVSVGDWMYYENRSSTVSKAPVVSTSMESGAKLNLCARLNFDAVLNDVISLAYIIECERDNGSRHGSLSYVLAFLFLAFA